MGVWHWGPTFALADRFRVVAMSPRGHGNSGREGPHTHAQVARDVHELIEHLGLRDVTLVGWSMGAFVVYEYLDAFGHEHLARVSSVDMTPRNNLADGWEHVVFGDLDMAKVVAASGAILHDRDGWQRGLTVACFAAGAQTDDATTEDWVREGLRASDASVLAYWIDLARSDWRELMPRIGLPSLFVQGAKSLACPTDVGSWVERNVPGARVRCSTTATPRSGRSRSGSTRSWPTSSRTPDPHSISRRTRPASARRAAGLPHHPRQAIQHGAGLLDA